MNRLPAPRDFRGPNPPERIIGTEMEYHVQAPTLMSAGLILAAQQIGYRSVKNFLDNGAKLYADVSHTEYATQECLGPWEAAAADHAGMQVVNQLVKYNIAKEGLTEGNALPAVRLSGSYDEKNDQIRSKGYHENFLTLYPAAPDERMILKRVMSSFLATSLIWSGNGLVADRYLLSQKAQGMGEPVIDGYGHRTMEGGKPLGAFLSDSGNSFTNDKISPGWALLERRFADCHMSRGNTFMDLGATSLVLRLIEQRIINSSNAADFILKHPIGTLHQLNQHFGAGKFELQSGKQITGLGLQKHFAREIAKLADSTTVELPADERMVAKKLLPICEELGRLCVKDPDLTPLISDVPWAAKLHYLKYYFGEDFITSKQKDAISFDRRWHCIDETSIGKIVARKYDPMHQDLEWKTKKLIKLPPATRATARVEGMRISNCDSVEWNAVKLKDGWKYSLSNPYDTNLPKPSR